MKIISDRNKKAGVICFDTVRRKPAFIGYLNLAQIAELQRHGRKVIPYDGNPDSEEYAFCVDAGHTVWFVGARLVFANL